MGLYVGVVGPRVVRLVMRLGWCNDGRLVLGRELERAGAWACRLGRELAVGTHVRTRGRKERPNGLLGL